MMVSQPVDDALGMEDMCTWKSSDLVPEAISRNNDRSNEWVSETNNSTIVIRSGNSLPTLLCVDLLFQAYAAFSIISIDEIFGGHTDCRKLANGSCGSRRSTLVFGFRYRRLPWGERGTKFREHHQVRMLSLQRWMTC